MSDKDFFGKHISSFDAITSDNMADHMARRETLKSTLLPDFTERVFPRTAGAYYVCGNAGLKAQFGKVSMLVDGFGGRMIVTLHRKTDGTMVSFGAHKEEPFGLFHDPTILSYSGRPADMSLMINQAAQGIKRAKRDGRQVFREYPVLAKMFG